MTFSDKAMPPKRETYLGDGVYVTFDSGDLILDLRAQDASRIVLEPEVFTRLCAFAKEILKEAERLKK